MGNSIYWVIALVVLQAVIGALAKRAQKNQEMARKQGGTPAQQAGARGGSPTPATAAPAQRSSEPVVVQRERTMSRPVEPARAPAPPRVGSAAPQKSKPAQGAQQTKIVRGAVTRQRTGDGKKRFGVGEKPRGAVRSTSSPARAAGASPAGSPASASAAVREAQRSNVRGGASAGLSGPVRAFTHVAHAIHSTPDSRAAAASHAHAMPALSAARLRAAIRDPARFREAFVIGELLGTPRGLRGF